MNLLSLVPKSMQNPEFSANTNYWLHFTRFPQLLNKHFHFRSLRRTRGRMIRQQRCPGSWPISRPGLSSVSSSLSSSNPPWNWSECVPNLKLGLSNQSQPPSSQLEVEVQVYLYLYLQVCQRDGGLGTGQAAERRQVRVVTFITIRTALLVTTTPHLPHHSVHCIPVWQRPISPSRVLGAKASKFWST